MAAAIESKRPDCAIELHGEEDKPGTFNVVADGTQLWSKHEMHGFPEHDKLIEQLPPSKEPPQT